jgi:hypothetical protein
MSATIDRKVNTYEYRQSARAVIPMINQSDCW